MHPAWLVTQTVAACLALFPPVKKAVPATSATAALPITAATLWSAYVFAAPALCALQRAQATPENKLRAVKLLHHVFTAAASGYFVVAYGSQAVHSAESLPTHTWGSRALYAYALAAWILFSVLDVRMQADAARSPAIALHHLVTLALIAGSSSVGQEIQGALVLFFSDFSDVALSWVKLAPPGTAHGRWTKAAVVVSWLLCRIVGLPAMVLVPGMHLPRRTAGQTGLLGALSVLTALNVMWTVRILKRAC